jgi:hypothetical protein
MFSDERNRARGDALALRAVEIAQPLVLDQ